MYILDGYTAVPSAGRPRVAMSRSLMCEEIAFSCSQGGGSGGLRVAAWDPSKGAVKRTYSCEAQGGGAALVLLGKTYLLCALKAMPFIYVWHLRKVATLHGETRKAFHNLHTIHTYTYIRNTAGASSHEDGLSGSGADSGCYA